MNYKYRLLRIEKSSFMKQNLILIFSVILILAGCSSVKNLNDYDSVSYEKKDYMGKEILGAVKVSKLGFTWEKYDPDDVKAIKLMNRLEQKALKLYGSNIELIEVEVGGMNAPITTALWTGGGAVGTAAAYLNSSNTEEVTNNGKKETVVKNQALYDASFGMLLGSFTVFLFKGIEASALVVRSDTPYKRGSYKLISDDEIIAKRNNYNLRKYEIERENQKKSVELEKAQRAIQLQREENEREAQLEKARNSLNNLKNQLIIRGKDVKSPIVILRKGISEINSADGVSCYVDFVNVSGKLAKYVKIDVTPYNRVFDQAYSHIDGSSNKTITITNFIGPNEEYTAAWENVWYNSTILTMEVTRVEMIFADNTKLVIDRPEDIKKIEFTSDEYAQYKKLNSSINSLMK